MNWLEAGRERRLDEIFALTTEQSGAVALTADARRRTSRSRGFDGEVITLAHPATRATGRGSPRAQKLLAVGKEPGPEAPVAVFAGSRSGGPEIGQRELAGLLERRDDPVVTLLAHVADDRRREDDGQAPSCRSASRSGSRSTTSPRSSAGAPSEASRLRGRGVRAWPS